MESLEKENSKINALKTGILVPTFNNDRTLRDVLQRILKYTDEVIVVNDGSTDNTKAILSEFSKLTIIEHSTNKGKGKALKSGFEKAKVLGYRHIITIDSDGQHFPEDLPSFFTEIEKHPDSLIMGARDMTQEEVPGKSSFGNRFSNFWYWVETGISLPDTQTGFRCYPISYLKRIKLFTSGFELEIESIVKLAWKGAEVRSIPVKVIYDYEDRVSHFRPFRDFMRISFLNTYLCILTLIYYLPLRIIKKIRREGFINILKKEWSNNSESDLKKSFSLGFGIMMGIFPVWGFQMIIAVALAYIFKLNKIIVLAASNISIPPMIPAIIYLSYLTGGIFIENEYAFSSVSDISLASININFLQYLIGAIVLSIVAGGLSFLLSFGLLRLFRSK